MGKNIPKHALFKEKCIRKAKICSQIVGPVSKASRANKLIKRIAITQRILGV